SLDLLSQGVAIELSWEEHTATYVRGDTGPQGERVNRKQVRIKARIPNLSKMQCRLQLENSSELGEERFFDDTFVKDGGSLEIAEQSTQDQVSDNLAYDISSGEDAYTIERALYLDDGDSMAGVKLNVTFQDTRARPLQYSDVFKLEFER
ncbi:hypothetical protein, partial [Salinicola sp. CPA57]|uniref:hypothetical protein n=1 Tax=Salinicola sp. CPA57 TaxID=1949080 RepID=UPI001E2EA3A5